MVKLVEVIRGSQSRTPILKHRLCGFWDLANGRHK